MFLLKKCLVFNMKSSILCRSRSLSNALFYQRSGLVSASQNQKQQQKTFVAEAQVKSEACPVQSTEMSYENALPFEKIPGPSKTQLIRAFLPGGMYHEKSLEELIQVSRKKYGDIYQWPGIFGRYGKVFTANPEDFPTVYRNEGVWPLRRGFETVVYHRTVLRKDYFQGTDGLIVSQGEDWGKLRTALNPVLMSPKSARLYFNAVQDSNSDFIDRIREVRNPETFKVPANFEEELLRLTCETVCSIALNQKLGLLKKNRNDPKAEVLLHHVGKFLFNIFDLEMQPPLWKFVKTKKFNEMMETLDTLTDLCDEYIRAAWKDIEESKKLKTSNMAGREESVLEKLAKIDHKIAVITAMDLMMAGVDTTSSTLSAALMCLSKNPDKQQKLFEEIKEILPEKDSKFTIEKLQNLPYLRACIKESMRRFSVGSSAFRALPVNVVLSGYRIPAGTEVVTGSVAYLNDPEYVPKPQEYIPERWLRTEKNREDLAGKLSRPFMFLPFGIGPRMCAGKRLLDLEMEINIARLVRNFEIGFDHPIENAFKTRLVIKPQIPLEFTFKERKE